jgi:hypothetical protein
MICPACSSKHTRVTCTNHFKGMTKRYCRCLSCHIKYRTVEKYEAAKPGPPKGKPRPGNISRGENHGSAILTNKNVLHMRRMYAWGHTLQVISQRYGLSTSYTSRIVNRKVWTHI